MAPYPKMGSRISHLMAMEVGARWYVEVDDGEDYKRFQRGVGADLARRPDVMKEWRFTTQVFTAVSSSKFGDVRYVICVERTS